MMNTDKSSKTRGGRIFYKNRLQFDPQPLIDAYVGGESELSISLRTGISRIVIRRRFIENGVAIRNGSEANRLRMSRLTFKERCALTAASHVGVKLIGKDQRRQIREKFALSRCQKRGWGEDILLERLLRLNLPAVNQTPCGIYNIDITVGTVAVELFSLPWEKQARIRFPKRFKYLADHGYTLLNVGFRRKPQFLGNIEDVIRIIQETYRLPPKERKHRMIRCGSNRFLRFKNNRGQFSVKSVPESFFYTASEIHP